MVRTSCHYPLPESFVKRRTSPFVQVGLLFVFKIKLWKLELAPAGLSRASLVNLTNLSAQKLAYGKIEGSQD